METNFENKMIRCNATVSNNKSCTVSSQPKQLYINTVHSKASFVNKILGTL